MHAHIHTQRTTKKLQCHAVIVCYRMQDGIRQHSKHQEWVRDRRGEERTEQSSSDLMCVFVQQVGVEFCGLPMVALLPCLHHTSMPLHFHTPASHITAGQLKCTTYDLTTKTFPCPVPSRCDLCPHMAVWSLCKGLKAAVWVLSSVGRQTQITVIDYFSPNFNQQPST